MNMWTRATTLAAAAIAVVAVGSVPVAAQSSTSIGLIDQLNLKLLYIAVPITLLVEFVLLYTVVKFKNADEAKPTQENRRLEITWTIATAVILLFVGVASYGVLADQNVTYQPQAEDASGDPVVVHAEAFQWGWEMSYPEAGNFTTGTEIVVPADRQIRIQVTSRDVIHGFHAPELGLKQDAMPEQVNTISTVPYEEGTYQGYCSEYCGVSHSQMYFSIEVVSEEEYQEWLDEQQSADDE